MKSFLAATAAATLIALLPASVQAEGRSKERRPACERAGNCGGGSTLSRADRENLSRAMSRNVLQSIDDRLRRQRYN